jgi:hypothetical protein
VCECGWTNAPTTTVVALFLVVVCVRAVRVFVAAVAL